MHCISFVWHAVSQVSPLPPWTHSEMPWSAHIFIADLPRKTSVSTEIFPFSHSLHVLSSFAPFSTEYSFTGQDWQLAVVESPYVPPGHSVHVVAELFEYFPASHFMHVLSLFAFSLLENLPATHSVQFSESGLIEYFPLLHGSQTNPSVPPFWVPTGQGFE